jgi:hypothetical protein
MALWATKRRFLYGGVFLIIALLILAWIFWGFFNKTPTCTDGVRNGIETGIDCGGSCKNLCSNDIMSPVVQWAKVFNISGDVYSATAYIENPNVNSKNEKAKYEFRIYDEDNKIILVKSGQTSIPKNKKFAIFETGIIVKNSKPKSAEFVFTSFSEWEKDEVKEPVVSIKYGSLENNTTIPRVVGTITNTSLVDIKEIELVVLVVDENENVIGSSRTFVDNLFRGTTQDFVFTWQKSFDKPVSVVNVIHRTP